MINLALYQPDIPQNAGTMMRLCAAMGIPLDIIEPCGFALDEKKLRRAAMDYINHLNLTRHVDWTQFQGQCNGRRKILLTTKADMPYTDFTFQPNDILIMGRESAGAPDHVHESCDARLLIPMAQNIRSLNIAVSAAMVIGEALRQTHQFHIKGISP